MKARLVRFVMFLSLAGVVIGYSGDVAPGGPSTSGTAVEAEVLPGTRRLEMNGDLAAQMIAGIDQYLMRQLTSSIQQRRAFWKQDFHSPEAYVRSVEANRERFRQIIGVVDPRKPVTGLELVGTTDMPSLVAKGNGFTAHAVRWPVLDGVEGEGLLLEPEHEPVAHIVALPDADISPEQLVGLAPGLPPEAQFARHLAETGYQVIVPVLIDRQARWSGSTRVGFTNQSHREFLYRAAFEMGRHIIGYEVQKILAAVDWFAHESGPKDPSIAVIGYGEGGLLALYAAAADLRIDAAVVSGYFQEREDVWQEPLYRNVWSLLREFGDAELAGLVAPRPLLIEASQGPERESPPPRRAGKYSASPGRLVSPPLESVRREFDRARPVFAQLGIHQNLRLILSSNGKGHPICDTTLREFMRIPGFKAGMGASVEPLRDLRPNFDPLPRLRRQFDQLNEYTQRLARGSEAVREQFWSKAGTSSLDRFIETSKHYRNYLWDEVIGRLPSPSEPLNPRTRRVYDEPKWRGYEVVLDVYPDVFAYGVLLLPKDLKPGERRPVVVCQHGLEGRPQDVIQRDGEGFQYYKAFAARLAERGFVVYAPQNPYTGDHDYWYAPPDPAPGPVSAEDGRYLEVQRKANSLKLSLFSFIIRQHERTLDWLAGQPFVDPARIGFYGLSYGGKTAMRVPAILSDRYALSICSGDFNEFVLKTTSTSNSTSFMFHGEPEAYEFDLGNTFNYAELASLIAPRPFMVESGIFDGTVPDSWVAYEYAKVRRLYESLGISDRTRIEFFPGEHEIHGEGTFAFLHKHLKWPLPE